MSAPITLTIATDNIAEQKAVDAAVRQWRLIPSRPPSYPPPVRWEVAPRPSGVFTDEDRQRDISQVQGPAARASHFRRRWAYRVSMRRRPPKIKWKIYDMETFRLRRPQSKQEATEQPAEVKNTDIGTIQNDADDEPFEPADFLSSSWSAGDGPSTSPPEKLITDMKNLETETANVSTRTGGGEFSAPSVETNNNDEAEHAQRCAQANQIIKQLRRLKKEKKTKQHVEHVNAIDYFDHDDDPLWWSQLEASAAAAEEFEEREDRAANQNDAEDDFTESANVSAWRAGEEAIEQLAEVKNIDIGTIQNDAEKAEKISAEKVEKISGVGSFR